MKYESAATLAAWLLAREFAEELQPVDAAVRTVRLSPFQASAASRASRIIERHGGVLIADSVGLGKTYIGIALIEAALRRGLQQILVTTPAAIRAQWWSMLRQVARASAVPLIGAHGSVRADRPVICWLSHTALSRERWPAALNPVMTVVDEAHAFRNPQTRRYRTLSRLCRNNQVVLLTATPINNSLRDLYWLLRLFLSDTAFADAGVSDLRLAFAEAELAGRLCPPLDAAVASVTVRRTRHMVLMREPHLSARFPRRDPPTAIRYNMESVVPRFYERVGESIAALRLDPLVATAASAGESRAPAELIRIGLLKRLESSVFAFCASLDALERFLTSFAEAALGGYRLRPAEHRTFSGGAGQLTMFGVALDPLPPSVDRCQLTRIALADATRLNQLREALEPVRLRDPKLNALTALLAGELRDRKVLVFTEFRDTATFLWQSLNAAFRVALVHGGGAWIGNAAASRLDAITRFSPASNGRTPPTRAEQVDVLIATDVLSEGLNLQDAADVVSYDLPWNPVRLIQRMGRIDRLGSAHECVRCWNFLPARGLESLLKLLERLAAKLGAIRAIGQESPVLSMARSGRGQRPPLTHRIARDSLAAVVPVARISSVVRRLERSDPLLFDELEREEEGPFTVLERARVLARRSEPRVALEDVAACDRDTPFLARIGGPPAQRHQYIVVVRTASGVLRWFFVNDGRVTEDRVEALRILVSILEDNLPSVSEPEESAASEIASVTRIVLQAVQPSPITPGPSLRRILALVRRRLLEALARQPGGPDPALCERTDRLLDQLAAGVRSGIELELQNVLRKPSRTALPAAALIRTLECAIDEQRGAGENGAGPGLESGPCVLAILELRQTPTNRPE
jgi:superfamily II DNA or RNA helicase